MATFGESWNQAAGATGVDQAGSSTYYILGLTILALEVIWWLGLAFFVNRGILAKLGTQEVATNPD